MTSNLPMIPTTAPLTVSQQMPDFLKDTKGNVAGIEGLTRSDFKIPLIKLLQGQSPELDANPDIARKNEFWHTGLKINLGPKLISVPALIKKTIVLFRPLTDNGGGILARSDDGINWTSGGNKKFTVKLKDVNEPVVWDTRRNVLESGLTEFGTSNPNNSDSNPAADTIYEYLLYLPEYDNASPAVLRLKSTGLGAGKDLNSYFALHGIPIYGHVIEWTPVHQSGNGGTWTNANPRPAGFVDAKTFKLVEEVNKNYASKMADLDIGQEEDVIEVKVEGQQKF